MKSPRILAVAYGGGHIAMVLPVMRALRERVPGVHIDLIALTTAYAAAIASGERPIRYADLLHLIDRDRALAYGRSLPNNQIHPEVGEEETLAYIGANYLDLVEQLGETTAGQLYSTNGRYSFRPLNFFRAVVEYLKPDLILATNSPRSEEAAIEVGIRMGIPTLSMVDLFVPSRDLYLRRRFFADVITVLDEKVKKNLVTIGIPASSVHVTGNPAFDGLRLTTRQQAADAFLSRMGWHGKQVVLWAGHIDDYSSTTVDLAKATAYPRAVEAELVNWVNSRDDRALIVRYHPNENQHFPEQPFHPRIFRSTSLQHVHEAILAADVVVVQMSTVGLESATAGKPVVALYNSPSSQAFKFNYEALGVAYGCPDIDQLPAAIERAALGGCVYKGSRLPPAGPLIADLGLRLVRS